MTLFKCKMCGGSIDVVNNESVAECEYCGTKQTLPKMDDEKRINLYNRANHFRQQCAFDKAEQIYEKIVAEMPDDAEAHWSLVLCRYGIEYVEDPSTLERVPTCHRASYDSIFDDIDYIEAVNKADTVAMSLYQKEAAKIDRIQKGILEISQKEKPFDIFICYKETDSIGERTLDSVKAQEIYDTLTDKGYKVFFSRITLEDKLGQSYEPYIFAALNSAKVMLVVGANPDYINSVWVKNEWSRYLKIMSRKKDRTLIPCYLNMSPYELPDEFSCLQGQDMSKIGFMQDLIKGIGKLIPKNNNTVKKTVVDNNNINGLINLIHLAIEEKKWKKADNLCEKLMIAQPDFILCYFFKLIISYQYKSRNISNIAKKLNELQPEISKQEKKFITQGNSKELFEIFALNNCISRAKYILQVFPEVISTNSSILSTAVFSENENCVKQLFEWGISANPSTSCGTDSHDNFSPLYYAILKKNIDMIKLLMEHGANVNESCRVINHYGIDYDIWKEIRDIKGPDSYGIDFDGDFSPLFYAILKKDIDIIKLLLEYGADPNWVRNITLYDGTETKVSMLGYAINEIAIVKLLLEHGADPNVSCEINSHDNYSPLYYAISKNNMDMIKLLLEYGADPNASCRINSRGNYSPLYYAISENNMDMIKLLLEHGADPNASCKVNFHDYFSPLYYAISKKNKDMIKLLLEHGADPNKSYKPTGEHFNLLSDVILNEDMDMTKLLLEHGANSNLIEDVQYRNGKTGKKSVLSSAIADIKSAEMVKLLLEYGANPNTSYRIDSDGCRYSPLSDAIYTNKSVEMAILLLEYDADPNTSYRIDSDGCRYSSLSDAICNSKSVDMVKLLLEHHADPNKSSRITAKGSQYSPLGEAIWSAKNDEMVKLFLDYDADPNLIEDITEDNGTECEKSMLSYAIIAKSQEMVKLLLEHGADPNKSYRTNSNKHGKSRYSPLSDAICNAKNVDMVKLLLEHGADPNLVEDRILDNGEKWQIFALHEAIKKRNIQIVKLLLEYGADLNKYSIMEFGSISSFNSLKFAVDISSFNSLKFAVDLNENILKLLLEYGADPNKCSSIVTYEDNEYRYSPLGCAIKDSNAKIVKLLLEHGADPNWMEYDHDGNKKSMLTYAIIDAKSEYIANMLIKHGATWKNTITYKGITKLEKHFPYNSFVSEDFASFLRDKGWTGDLIALIIKAVAISLIVVPVLLFLLSHC